MQWPTMADVSQTISGLGASAVSVLTPEDVFRIVFSFGVMLLVLVWLAIVYRGGAGDEEIERPVTLALLTNSEERTIVLAPRHLNERSTHIAKAPRVQFFVQVPNRRRYEFKAAEIPLRISIRDRNSSMVHDHELKRDGRGGQIGIDSTTRDRLEEYFAKLERSDGRKFDADTAEFVVKLKYPISLNLVYLLREHPDASVRVGAWIFILTSVFSIIQELIFRD